MVAWGRTRVLGPIQSSTERSQGQLLRPKRRKLNYPSAGPYTYIAQEGNSSAPTSSRSTAMPTGTTEGDVVFVYAIGRDTNTDTVTYTPPAGWEPIGEVLRTYDASAANGNYTSMQLWWKVAGASEGSASITRNNATATLRDWRVGSFCFRPTTLQIPPRIVGRQEESLGTSTALNYTPAPIAGPSSSGIMVAFCTPDVSGTPTLGTANGWLGVALTTGAPPSGMLLRATAVAGVIPSPTITAGFDKPWVSKTILLD
jgi:hypothetical protein